MRSTVLTILFTTLGAFVASVAASAQTSAPTQPTRNVQVSQLPNGMTVALYTIDHAHTVFVQLRISTGANEESEWAPGVSHLVQHALLRDEAWGKTTTLLHMVKHFGGEARVFIGPRETIFEGSVIETRVLWLMEQLWKSMRPHRLSSESLSGARFEVEAEKGGFGLAQLESRSIARSFLSRVLEAEFGVRRDRSGVPFLPSYLAVSDSEAQEFFDRHYDPRAMTLIVAGPVDSRDAQVMLSRTFAQMTQKPEWSTRPEKVRPKSKPFVRYDISPLTSSIELGTKFWQLSAQDEVVLTSYVMSFARRLAAELSEKRGQAVDVTPEVEVRDARYGLSRVVFRTTRERYAEDKSLAQAMLVRETRQGKLATGTIRAAKEHFLSQTLPDERDVRTAIPFCSSIVQFQKRHGTHDTPADVLSRITPDEYRKRLAKVFAPTRAYERYRRPEFLFPFESLLLSLLALGLAAWCSRKTFWRRMDEIGSIEMAQHLRLDPWTFLIYASFLVALVGAEVFANFAFEEAAIRYEFLRSQAVFRDYLLRPLITFIDMYFVLSFFCLVPRTLVIRDNRLQVKRMLWASRSYALDEIAEVSAQTLLPVLIGTRGQSQIHQFSPFRKGLFVHFKNGQGLLLPLKHPEKTAEILVGRLNAKRPQKIVIPPPRRLRDFTRKPSKAA